MAFTNPLQWPVGQLRTQKRRKAPFGAKMSTIVNELDRTVHKLGITDIRITTNRRVRIDGQLSMANADNAADPAIAVYFKRKGQDVCIAFDKFNDIWGNLRAVGLYLEYMARLETYDMTEIADKAFTGFTALPVGTIVTDEPWYIILGVESNATKEEIRDAYREKIKRHHPDVGGSVEQFKKIRDAYERSLSL